MQRARFPAMVFLGIVDRRFEIRSNIVRKLVYSSVFTSSIFWAVAAALLGGPMDATAADLALKMPVKAPVATVAAPIYSWTGWYGGIHGGYGWGDSRPGAAIDPGTVPLPPLWSINGPVPGAIAIADPRTKGGLFGAQLGYNYQFDRTVIGVETDISWSAIKGSTSAAPFSLSVTSGDDGRFDGTGRLDTKLDWFGTLRGRLGYSLDHVLPYITAGLAYGDIKTGLAVNGSTFDTGVSPARLVASTGGSGFTSSVHTGYALGAGTDWAVTDQWMLRAEYMYLNFGGNGSLSMPLGSVSDSGMTVHLVRGALNYRF
jgi:outer membrane immunogenic protein